MTVVRRGACRTVLTALVLALMAGCSRDDADPRGGGYDRDRAAVDAWIGDSVTAGADAVAAAADAVPPPIEMAEPPVLTAAPDPGLIATPDELAELRAVLVVPVAGVERSELHDTFEELRGDRAHEAIDILAPRGTPVLSATDGRLLRLFDSVPGGLMIYATDASERFILLYGHLDGYAPGVHDGMLLVRGQVIGYVGTTGNAPPDTPHLHFGILRGQPAVSWSNGVAVNPFPLLVRGN